MRTRPTLLASPRISGALRAVRRPSPPNESKHAHPHSLPVLLPSGNLALCQAQGLTARRRPSPDPDRKRRDPNGNAELGGAYSGWITSVAKRRPDPAQTMDTLWQSSHECNGKPVLENYRIS